MKVTTIAGRAGECGNKRIEDGKLSNSRFQWPSGLCLDGEGRLLVVDSLNCRIRRLDLVNGTVSTIAGCDIMKLVDGDAIAKAVFNYPSYMAIHGSTIYVSDTLNNAIRKIEGGIVSTFATGFDHPLGITVDENGDVLVADSWNCVIKRIGSKDGSIHVLPSILYPVAIAISSDGVLHASSYENIYRLDDSDWKIVTRTDDRIQGLKSDSSHGLLFTQPHCIKKVNLTNCEVSLIAGSEKESGAKDGSPLESRFCFPHDVVVNDSFIYVSDKFNDTIRRIDHRT